MNTAFPLRSHTRNGFSLLELAVVIAVLLSLTSILMVGARAWMHGSDRLGCLMNIRNVQMAVRSYQNLYGYSPGGMPYAEDGTQDIARHLFAKGYITAPMYGVASGLTPCPGGGTCSADHPHVFPPVGTLYLKCSLADTRRHFLEDNAEW